MVDGRTFDWRQGAVAGLVGAIAYTVFVEAVNVAVNGFAAFFFPFRQIGAVVLGSIALNDSYNLLVAVAVGTIVHFAIAALFGIVMGGIITRFALRGGSSAAVGLIAGLLFYVLNVFVIFPIAFPWFLSNDRLIQSLGHALFGGVTGIWFARQRSSF